MPGLCLTDDDGGKFGILDEDHEVDLASHRILGQLGPDNVEHPAAPEPTPAGRLENRQGRHHRDGFVEVCFVQRGHDLHAPSGRTGGMVGDVGTE